MIICDSHIHSEFSSDSSAPLDSIIQKAIQLGIPKICLTDHHDIDFPINPEDGFDFQLDYTVSCGNGKPIPSSLNTV